MCLDVLDFNRIITYINRSPLRIFFFNVIIYHFYKNQPNNASKSCTKESKGSTRSGSLSHPSPDSGL